MHKADILGKNARARQRIDVKDAKLEVVHAVLQERFQAVRAARFDPDGIIQLGGGFQVAVYDVPRDTADVSFLLNQLCVLLFN